MIMSTNPFIKEIPMKKSVLGVFAVMLVCLACNGKQLRTGLVDGKLQPCPASPNCVLSQDPDDKHQIAPLTFKGNRDTAVPLLRDCVKTMAGATLVAEEEGYLRFEFKTRVFRFVDDVEFLFQEGNLIHVRSASRTGYSDLGVNRKRIEKIRKMFDESMTH